MSERFNVLLKIDGKSYSVQPVDEGYWMNYMIQRYHLNLKHGNYM